MRYVVKVDDHRPTFTKYLFLPANVSSFPLFPFTPFSPFPSFPLSPFSLSSAVSQLLIMANLPAKPFPKRDALTNNLLLNKTIN